MRHRMMLRRDAAVESSMSSSCSFSGQFTPCCLLAGLGQSIFQPIRLSVLYCDCQDLLHPTVEAHFEIDTDAAIKRRFRKYDVQICDSRFNDFTYDLVGLGSRDTRNFWERWRTLRSFKEACTAGGRFALYL